jgi:hypothetical protein
MFHKGQNFSKAFVLYSHLFSLYGHLLPLRSYALYGLLPSTALYLSTAFYPPPPSWPSVPLRPCHLYDPLSSPWPCPLCPPFTALYPHYGLLPSLWPSVTSSALFLLYGPLSPLWSFIPSTALYNPLSPLQEMFFLTVL